MSNKDKTSTALAVPSGKLIPPPRKSEIIMALVERAKQVHAAEQAELGKKIAKAKSDIESIATKELARNIRKLPRQMTLRYRYSSEVEFEVKVVTPELTEKIRAYKLLEDKRSTFDEKGTRKHITAGMGADVEKRVNAMLTDPETLKALDATLQHIAANP